MADQRHQHHIMWVYLTKALEALGPEKGRQVLAETTDMIKEKGIWDTCTDAVVDEASEAYLCSVKLKDMEEHIDGAIYEFKLVAAKDHYVTKVKQGMKPDEAKALVESMKADGFMPPQTEAPTAVDENGNVRLLNEAEIAQYLISAFAPERDEFGATKGCDCPKCQKIRSDSAKPENQPN